MENINKDNFVKGLARRYVNENPSFIRLLVGIFFYMQLYSIFYNRYINSYIYSIAIVALTIFVTLFFYKNLLPKIKAVILSDSFSSFILSKIKFSLPSKLQNLKKEEFYSFVYSFYYYSIVFLFYFLIVINLYIIFFVKGLGQFILFLTIPSNLIVSLLFMYRKREYTVVGQNYGIDDINEVFFWRKFFAYIFLLFCLLFLVSN